MSCWRHKNVTGHTFTQTHTARAHLRIYQALRMGQSNSKWMFWHVSWSSLLVITVLFCSFCICVLKSQWHNNILTICAAHESDTRVRTNTNQKLKSKNIRERWVNTFWRNFSKRAVTCLCAVLEKMMNTKASEIRSISINSTFERVNVMHIYINGDNWLLWILSTIRSKTKIISSRRVAYCNTAALHFPRNETLQHHEARTDHWGNTQYSPSASLLFLAFVS